VPRGTFEEWVKVEAMCYSPNKIEYISALLVEDASAEIAEEELWYTSKVSPIAGALPKAVAHVNVFPATLVTIRALPILAPLVN